MPRLMRLRNEAYCWPLCDLPWCLDLLKEPSCVELNSYIVKELYVQ
jgi:hypothetical protein